MHCRWWIRHSAYHLRIQKASASRTSLLMDSWDWHSPKYPLWERIQYSRIWCHKTNCWALFSLSNSALQIQNFIWAALIAQHLPERLQRHRWHKLSVLSLNLSCIRPLTIFSGILADKPRRCQTWQASDPRTAICCHWYGDYLDSGRHHQRFVALCIYLWGVRCFSFCGRWVFHRQVLVSLLVMPLP